MPMVLLMMRKGRSLGNGAIWLYGIISILSIILCDPSNRYLVRTCCRSLPSLPKLRRCDDKTQRTEGGAGAMVTLLVCDNDLQVNIERQVNGECTRSNLST